MPRARIALGIAAQPLDVARRLADRSGVALLWTALGPGPSYVLCDPVESRRALDPEPELPLAPRAEEGGEVPRWLGILPYESCRALERQGRALADRRARAWFEQPTWWRYRAVARVTDRVVVIGEDEAAARSLARLLERPPRQGSIQAAPSAAPEPPEVHVRRIERALEYIRAGDLYQVNLARHHALRVAGHPLDLLSALTSHAPAPYAMALGTAEFGVVSTSPELFLRSSPGGLIETSPIKGTRPRGRNAAEDTALAAELDADPKERAELTMVLDVERNDLGRISEPGSVILSEPPAVRTYGSVHHRLATLQSRLRPGVSRAELLRALLPSGSVTGAPKVRAMEVIAELEAQRRGLYTGAFGVLTQAGGLELAMAIRTLCLRGGEGEYFTGGGIVADSDPLLELEETRWKAAQLSALLSREAEPIENWAASAVQS